MDAEDSWTVLSRRQRPIDPAAGAWTGLIGFARAVTDGIYRAYIEDVIVAPAQRGDGIAHALVDCLLGEPTPAHHPSSPSP